MTVERISQVGQTKPWYGDLSAGVPDVSLYGQYTFGIAGDRFFAEIRDNGKLMGTICECCNLTYLPPRIYCERCFSELKEWREVDGKGEIYTFTSLNIDLDGKKLAEPVLLALVKFSGVYGGLVHRIRKVKPEEIAVGIPVKVVFKPKNRRSGSILDIEGFEPL